MINKKLSKIFYEMAELLEMDEAPFKPRAYEKAAQAIEELGEDVGGIYKVGRVKALEGIEGVGKGIAERIEEYIKTGKIKDYGKLKKKMPVNISELISIEGVGPHLIKLFYEKLKIKDVDDLERAARAGKLAELPRSGKKLEQKILKGIEFYKKSSERFLLGEILPVAEELEKKYGGVAAGSFRRRKETVGDLDILIPSPHPGKGEKRKTVHFDNGLRVDLRYIDKKNWGSASQYFTGSKAHNIELRKIAIKQGYKLNEYGLFKTLNSKSKTLNKSKTQNLKPQRYVAGRTEEEIYEKLGLQYIEPEMRENTGELGLAQKKKLPKLVELGDIKGDLQIHTTSSDGVNTIEEYVKEAQKRGYEYLLITDHTKALAMTGGMDEKGFLKQIKEINQINSKLQTLNSKQTSSFKLQILAGVEVDIMKDGSLYLSDEVLAKFDIVGAAIHSHFKLTKKEQTARMIKAMENPHVDIILHPTTRRLKQRPELELDMEEIFKVAARTGTILEINSSPDRLDLKDIYIRKAGEMGVMFVISTDAHSVEHLQFMQFGVWQARRGWCRKEDVVNALPLEKLLALFKKPKTQRF